MFYKLRNRFVVALTAMASCIVFTCMALGDPGSAEIIGDAHARGFLLVKFTLPGNQEVERIELQIKRPGDEYRIARPGIHRGRFGIGKTMSEEGQPVTTVWLPVIAEYDLTPRGFLFDRPGIYELRWSLYLDNATTAVEVEQPIPVASANEQDSRFLRHLGSEQFFRNLHPEFQFPEPVLQKWSGNVGDLRALILIQRLVEGIELFDPPVLFRTWKTPEQLLRAAQAFSLLAKEFPESTYAPYAAYYAGCAYSSLTAKKNREEHGNLVSKAAIGSTDYRAAMEMLTLAQDLGGAFIGNRVEYQRTLLLCYANQLDSATMLANGAVAESDDSVLRVHVSKIRKEISGQKQKRAKD